MLRMFFLGNPFKLSKGGERKAGKGVLPLKNPARQTHRASITSRAGRAGGGGCPRGSPKPGLAYSLSEVAVSSLIFPSPCSAQEMEEQQQAGKQRQRRHRGAAGGGGGRRGAQAAARGPHHGGRLTGSGAPRAGQPGHPRRGAAAASAAVATPAVRCAEAGCDAETARAAAGAGKERGRRLRRCCLLSQGRDDRRATGAGGGQPSAGCGRRRGPAEVPRTISRLAAGCPRGAPGRPSGAPLRRAPAGGGGQGAKRPSEPEGTAPSGGEQGRDQRSSAGPLLTPARGEPRGGRRKLSRRPLLPPREPGAPAGEAGEIVPRDFWGGGARAGAGGKADVGRGCERVARGLRRGGGAGGERPKSQGPQANHCSSRSWAA
ncbi:translation initiation factor IF-2-like [Alexandromys fortis]|uniref:translation initiation factor IF-2-like n=1 Tax=Alexandromys fortis TaxID=100897 RepID=UPI002152F1FF|nr:translation initiation factor IF-2-like [Microtus fortis]